MKTATLTLLALVLSTTACHDAQRDARETRERATERKRADDEIASARAMVKSADGSAYRAVGDLMASPDVQSVLGPEPTPHQAPASSAPAAPNAVPTTAVPPPGAQNPTP